MPLWPCLSLMNKEAFDMTPKRKKAIIRRRIFIALLLFFITIIIALMAVVIAVIKNGSNNDGTSSSHPPISSVGNSSLSDNASSDYNSSKDNSEQAPSVFTTPTGVTLDADFSRLLLVNGSNPLPDDYDTNVRADLVEIDPQYRNNNYVTKIHKDVYPYITALVAAAQADGVDLRVWSPFRSYADQRVLFENQVNRVGGDEVLAATVVARPGTSEHNTGICADFNMADDAFENTEMFTWMKENAEDYGFILRYPADKQDITGVIYESWHWRFVGINTAKEMNKLGLTLEEYVEQKGIDAASELRFE